MFDCQFGFWPLCFCPENSTVHHAQQRIKAHNDQIKELQRQNRELGDKAQELGQQLEHLRSELLSFVKKEEEEMAHRLHPVEKRRIRRRRIDKNFSCPYPSCDKNYGSSLALNLHIKQKHNGGNKRERETYAKIIIEHELKGEAAPKIDCQFPPGYLDSMREKHLSQVDHSNHVHMRPKQQPEK